MTGTRNVTVLGWLLLASMASFASPSSPEGVTVVIDDARSQSHAAQATDNQHAEWEEIENALELSKEGTSCKYRIARGGAWDGFAVQLRTANRARGAPTVRRSALGFRVARTL